MHKVPRFNFQGKGRQADQVGKTLKKRKEERHLKEKGTLKRKQFYY